MTTRPHVRITPEEYLRTGRAAEWKSEYIDGEMFAMAGASPRHVLIATNVARELGNQLRAGPCTVYTADCGFRRHSAHYTTTTLWSSAIRRSSWMTSRTVTNRSSSLSHRDATEKYAEARIRALPGGADDLGLLLVSQTASTSSYTRVN